MTSQTNSTPDLALIGAGYWGKNLARNFQALGALHPNCDANETTLASCGTEYAEVKKVGIYDAVLLDASVRMIAVAAPAVAH